MAADSARRRILFVEDEEALRISYQRFFRRDYEVEFAATGAEAVERMAEFDPDVLVLDMRLPDTDGVELLQKIRQDKPDLPVVITTAYVSVEPQLQVLDLDYSGYLVKPFDLNDLRHQIDAAS